MNVEQRSNRGGETSETLKALVFNIMRYSVHDGPGLRTTVFLKGCPLSCQWCHNPESQSRLPELMFTADRCVRCGDCVPACPAKAIQWQDGPIRNGKLCTGCGACVDACAAGARQLAGHWMTVPELLQTVSRDVIFFDQSGGGVTFSGGEPLSHPKFLEAILDACRASGIRTAVDTSGYAPRKVVESVSSKTDLFLFDLKVVDPVKHKQVTGVRNDLILENLSFLARENVPVIIRIPIVPTVNDDDANIDASIGLLSGLGLRQVDLLAYHRIGVEKYERLQVREGFKEFPAPSAERMESIAERFKNAGFTVRIGG